MWTIIFGVLGFWDTQPPSTTMNTMNCESESCSIQEVPLKSKVDERSRRSTQLSIHCSIIS